MTKYVSLVRYLSELLGVSDFDENWRMVADDAVYEVDDGALDEDDDEFDNDGFNADEYGENDRIYPCDLKLICFGIYGVYHGLPVMMVRTEEGCKIFAVPMDVDGERQWRVIGYNEGHGDILFHKRLF